MINTNVPAIIRIDPIAVFNVKVSPKKITARIIVIARLSLSTATT